MFSKAQLATLGKHATLSVRTREWNVHAITRPAFWQGGRDPIINVDNVLVTTTRVHDRDAIVIALAHGNYKDECCAYASSAFVATLAQELSEPLLSDADVSSALQRAFVVAHDRMREIARTPLREVQVKAGVAIGGSHRKSLAGIGASGIAAIACSRYAWIAHVGENGALIAAQESSSVARAKKLVLPHTIGNSQKFRGQFECEPEALRFHQDMVFQVLGADDEQPRIDVSRVPLASGTRLILGNASLTRIDCDLTGAAHNVVTRIVDTMSIEHEEVPATAIVARLE